LELIPPKSRLEEEYALLKTELSSVGSPIVFCHNDLLLANVIYNAEKNSVTFIDYEYSNYNYQAFDIGNHFAEFAGKILQPCPL
jgi:ethanolamine kinase